MHLLLNYHVVYHHQWFILLSLVYFYADFVIFIPNSNFDATEHTINKSFNSWLKEFMKSWILSLKLWKPLSTKNISCIIHAMIVRSEHVTMYITVYLTKKVKVGSIKEDAIFCCYINRNSLTVKAMQHKTAQ